MKVNELEVLLGTPRANIRYYEKEGLLSPKRSENGYRDYSEEDIAVLKKIIIFRKLGFNIADIKAILNGEISSSEVAEQNIAELQKQMEELKGALVICEMLKKDTSTFDETYYWDLVQSKEKEGWSFVEYAKDYLLHEQNVIIQVFENAFFYPLGDSVQKRGFVLAFLGVLVLCVVRGVFVESVWNTGSFLEGFIYPFILCLFASVVSLPMYVMEKKYNPKMDETEEDKKPKFLKGMLFLLIALLGVGIVLFIVPMIVEAYIYDYILMKDTLYVVSSKVFVFCVLTGVSLVVSFIWFFAGYPVLGIKCHIPKEAKVKLAVFWVALYMASLGCMATWYEAITPNGVSVRHFFAARNYTWDDVDYYEVAPAWDRTIRYTIVLEDGTRADLIGGAAGFSNLPEEQYPNDSESFGLELAELFTEKEIPIRADWEKMDRALDYDYWKDYAKQIREIVE